MKDWSHSLYCAFEFGSTRSENSEGSGREEVTVTGLNRIKTEV